MSEARKDRAAWLILPCLLLTLSSVTVLAPRQAAQAAPPSLAAAANPAPPRIEDDGDGDELLEHWGDPKYAREERLQLVLMGGGFLLFGGLACRKRVRRPASGTILSLEEMTEQRKAA